jgi:hypothetical protein
MQAVCSSVRCTGIYIYRARKLLASMAFIISGSMAMSPVLILEVFIFIGHRMLSRRRARLGRRLVELSMGAELM